MPIWKKAYVKAGRLEKAVRHKHEETQIEINLCRTVSRIKRRAEEHPIIREEVRNLDSEEVQALLPEADFTQRMENINQNIHRPLIPRTLTECVILLSFDGTLQGDPFLQYDSGVVSDYRLIIFTTNDASLSWYEQHISH